MRTVLYPFPATKVNVGKLGGPPAQSLVKAQRGSKTCVTTSHFHLFIRTASSFHESLAWIHMQRFRFCKHTWAQLNSASRSSITGAQYFKPPVPAHLQMYLMVYMCIALLSTHLHIPSHNQNKQGDRIRIVPPSLWFCCALQPPLLFINKSNRDTLCS